MFGVSDFEGPMGWGHESILTSQFDDEEKRGIDRLVETLANANGPYVFGTKPPKSPVNQEVIDKVLERQQAHGIDDGFCLHLLPEVIYGKQFRFKAQKIGSCVASGDMRATAMRMLAEVFIFNDAESLPGHELYTRDTLAFFAPYSYRAGRKIGGLNSGDGSFCSAHIQGKMKYGHLDCNTEGLQSDDWPEPQSQSTYRRWGNSNSLLEQFAPVAKKFPLLESDKVTGAEQAKRLLVEHKKPLNICSSWSFAADKQHASWKDADGNRIWIYRRGSRPWYHNMTIAAYAVVNGKGYFYVLNSWGPRAHKNGPGFWIPADLADTWLGKANCQSVGEIDLSDNPPPWPGAPGE